MKLFSLAMCLLQATSVISPHDDGIRKPEAGRAGADRSTDFDLSKMPPKVRGSVNSPVIVHEDKIRSVAEIIAGEQQVAARARSANSRSIVMQIPPDARQKCDVVADYPRGFAVRKGVELNGRQTTLKCDHYVAQITREDYRRPLAGVASAGFPTTDVSAIINGGAVAKSFYKAESGRASVDYEWIGRGQSIVISLTSESIDVGDLSANADRIIDRLTRLDV